MLICAGLISAGHILQCVRRAARAECTARLTPAAAAAVLLLLCARARRHPDVLPWMGTEPTVFVTSPRDWLTTVAASCMIVMASVRICSRYVLSALCRFVRGWRVGGQCAVFA